MKTLLIITSIILISFQIDRLFVHDLLFTGDAIAAANYAVNDNNTLPDEHKPMLIDKEPGIAESPASTAAPTLNDATEYAEKKEPVAGRSAVSSFTRVNERNMQLHHQLKQSENYLALTTLQFNFNEYQNIETEAFNNILRFADRLIFDASLKVSIAGFTDITGSPAYNQQLSLLRAENIKEYMIDLGVKESQITVSANGISFPVASNNTRQGRSANRRVEILLIQ